MALLQHLKPIAAYYPIIPERGLNGITQPIPSRDSRGFMCRFTDVQPSWRRSCAVPGADLRASVGRSLTERANGPSMATIKPLFSAILLFLGLWGSFYRESSNMSVFCSLRTGSEACPHSTQCSPAMVLWRTFIIHSNTKGASHWKRVLQIIKMFNSCNSCDISLCCIITIILTACFPSVLQVLVFLFGAGWYRPHWSQLMSEKTIFWIILAMFTQKLSSDLC